MADPKPTKATLRALGAVFAAEVNGRLPFQSKARIYRQLNSEELLQPMTRRFGAGPFAATVTGYELTHAGRFLYCESCDDAEEPTDAR